MKYDFDTVYDRHHTNSAKYDSGHTDDPNIFDGYLGRGLWKNHTRYIKIQLQQYKLILPTYLVIGKQ